MASNPAAIAAALLVRINALTLGDGDQAESGPGLSKKRRIACVVLLRPQAEVVYQPFAPPKNDEAFA